MLKSKTSGISTLRSIFLASRPLDDLSHVTLLEAAAGIVATHFILIGFPRRPPIVDPQYFLNHVESFLRLLAEKQMPFQESSKKRACHGFLVR